MPVTALAADWTGAASNDWFTGGNWSPGTVPTAGSAVAINTITPNPTAVDGANAVAASIIVGESSTGMLTILNAGTVSSALGYIGYNLGSSGMVEVTGPGAIWSDSARVYVGNEGTGTLTISNGGTVSNGLGMIGNFSGSDGTVLVDGAGSTWTNSLDLLVGVNGTGSLTISNGGKVTSFIGSVGNGIDSIGTATIDGANSTWTNSSYLIVGGSGTGALTISNGGTVNSTDGYLGYTGGSAGMVTVTGTGSTWSNSGPLIVGNSGSGTLNIINGGAVSSNIGTVGAQAGSTGVATLNAAGSSWSNSGELRVGDFGTGTLMISNGGTVSNAEGRVGIKAGSTGMVTVDGVGATWTNSYLSIGERGAGTLTISNGGKVTNTGQSAVGRDGGTGTVTVTGAGSAWINGENLYIGDVGNGTLTISNGGAVSNLDAALGYSGGVVADHNGTATVDGAGSTWTNNGKLTVGARGNGTLTIVNGGSVSSAEGHVGIDPGSTGIVTVNGAGSSWSNSSDLYIGNRGTGTLTISNGGTVSNAEGRVGIRAGSTGIVTVDGVGTTWANSYLSIGERGTGTLTISNGGTVTNTGQSAVGRDGGTGIATVTGAGSAWINGENLYIGDVGNGTLTISNGGAVSNLGAALGYSGGVGADHNGTVMVDGAGSTWTNNGNLTVGNRGTGTLTISNGGTVINSVSQLGYDTGSTGSVTVAGVSSTWANSGDLYVGNFGTGTLTIANRGMVLVGGVAIIASQAGSVGTLNIGSAAGSTPVDAGTLNAPNVVFGLGSGAINFNHTDASYTFAPMINGLGTINQLAGNTIINTDSSGFTGATNIIGGRLAVNGSLANSLVTVSGGGVLRGNGIVGGIVANAGSIIGPGNSIGTLTVNGNISQAAGSIYQVELTSTGLTDRINATGAATIANGATLNVIKMDAAPYVLGTHYTVLEAAGGVSGTYLFNDIQFSNFIGLADHYDATHVYLDVSKTRSFASAGLTPNQIAAGAGADSLPIGNALVDAIAWLPTDAAARRAFDQISGDIHASAKGVMIDDSRFVREAALDRLRAAFDSVGAVTTPVTAYVDGRPVLMPASSDRFAVWGRGFGSWGQWNGDGNAATVKRDIGGFFVGADGFVVDSWRVGMVGGYSRSSFNVRDRNSSGSSDNYHVGLYGGTQWGDLAFRSGLAYTRHGLSTSRSVAFPGFADSLKGNYNAGTAQAFGELGYRLRAGKFAFEPFANLAYINLRTYGFKETGGAAALTSQSSATDATFTTLGMRASTNVVLDNGVSMTTRGMLGWRHAFGDTTPISTLAFTGGSSFSIASVPIGRDAAVVDVGLDLNLTPTATLGLTYGGQFSSGVTDQTVRGNFAVKF